MPKRGEVVVTDRRAAGLPEPQAGASDEASISGEVTRIAGVKRELTASGDPLAFLPPAVAGVVNPEAIGPGGVSRQTGVVIRDAAVPGTIRADVRAEEVGGTSVPTLLADRAVDKDETQVIAADVVAGLGKPVGGGVVDVARVDEALHREHMAGGVLVADRPARGAEPKVSIGQAPASQSLPEEQLAHFREGRVFPADRPHRVAATGAAETRPVKAPDATRRGRGRPRRQVQAPAPAHPEAPKVDEIAAQSEDEGTPA